MSIHKLRSYEDLASYKHFLDENYDYFKDTSNYVPSFSQDPQQIIEDLLSQIVSTRKKALKTTKIAKKFYKAEEDSVKKIKDLHQTINDQQQELNDILGKLSDQDKEIHTKDKRIDSMEHELHETEKEYRSVLTQLEKLRTENKVLKESKQPTIHRQKTQFYKKTEDFEDTIKDLKETIEDLNQELDRKSAEAETSEKRIKEILAFANAEKAASDRIRASMAELKRENDQLMEKLEEVETELDMKKSRSYQLEQEIIKQKNYFDLLKKQHEQEKLLLNGNHGRVSTELHIEPSVLDIPENDEETIISSKRNANRVETLSEWITEDDTFMDYSSSPAPSNSKQIFILSTPTVSYNHFNFAPKTKDNLTIQPSEQTSILPPSNHLRTENFPVLSIRANLTTSHYSLGILRAYEPIHPHSTHLQSFPGTQSDPLKLFFILVTPT